ncbi:carbohydrate kinase family protein [Candidatus Methylomicrobium oryzae]|uniref:carbohydrate kinase family protein n=1 Tax=Candidatus Methylomicrobium oryzae TaxID=2802053 RepID=UPI001923EDAF|nr:carbohydrate kinase [Methylomicrobium sp. RS1]MBL1264471.1 carbohydrate kinase [Methylomicrobium sp. RS1]
MNDNPPIHVFGEVLFDHFPDGNRVLGGAPFNVAWHLQAFGQSPRFISRIGGDAPGREIASLMEAWGMSRAGLQIDRDHPTGSVRVLIRDGEPHYEIVADCAYDFIAAESLEDKDAEGILYHGSLAVRNPAARAALEALKTRHRGKVFVDVNLRPPWWDKATLRALLDGADWVKLNEAELAELSPESGGGLEAAMVEFYELFDLETLVVTRGEKGAVAWDRREHFVAVQPSAGAAVVDTVGAGDAFAAVLVLGLNRQWPLDLTLERAQAFAGALVGRRGATVAEKAFYRAFLDEWN